jgi:hypothetical protein
VSDVRVGGWGIRRGLTGDGCEVEAGVFAKFFDDGAADVASSLLPINIKPHELYTKMMIERVKHTPRIAMFLSSMFGVLRFCVAAGGFLITGCELYQVSLYGDIFLCMRSN